MRPCELRQRARRSVRATRTTAEPRSLVDWKPTLDDETVEPEVPWVPALPHPENATPTAIVIALVRILWLTSGSGSGEGCVVARCLDDLDDRSTRVGRGVPVLDEHRVLGVRKQLVEAVGRERGEFVLRGHPAAFGVLLGGQNDEGRSPSVVSDRASAIAVRSSENSSRTLRPWRGVAQNARWSSRA